MRLVFDSLHSRILERQAFDEGLLHTIEDEIPFFGAANMAYNRLPASKVYLDRCLTDISLFPSSEIVGSVYSWRHPFVGKFRDESDFFDPDLLIQKIKMVKTVLKCNRRYFSSSAPLDPRFWDVFDPNEEFVASRQLDVDRRTYELMLEIIEQEAIFDIYPLLDDTGLPALKIFSDNIEPICREWGYTDRYILEQYRYFQAVWTTFGDLIKVELGAGDFRSVFRTNIVGQRDIPKLKLRDDVFYTIRKDFSKAISLVPEPRSIEEARELSERAEVKRLSEMIDRWVDAFEDSNTKLARVIENDISKASKEVSRIKRFRRATDSDLGIFLKAALSQIPIVSNVTGVADAAFAFYEKHTLKRTAWLSSDT